MICTVCGTQNNEGVKFCIRCGANIGTLQPSTPMPNGMQSVADQQSAQTYRQPPEFQQQPLSNPGMPASGISYSQGNNSSNTQEKQAISSYFIFLIAVMMKPMTILQEELDRYKELKHSLILASIVSLFATFCILIQSMLRVVMEKSYDWSTGKTGTKWVWENLKELDYVQLVGKNLLLYLGIIAAISGIFYLASLVVKKELNFSKLLACASSAVVPLLSCSLLLSPLVSLVYQPLGMVVLVIGSIDTVVILYEAMNQELKLEGDKKIYFNLICFSIIALGLSYLYSKYSLGSVTSILGKLGY